MATLLVLTVLTESNCSLLRRQGRPHVPIDNSYTNIELDNDQAPLVHTVVERTLSGREPHSIPLCVVFGGGKNVYKFRKLHSVGDIKVELTLLELTDSLLKVGDYYNTKLPFKVVDTAVINNKSNPSRFAHISVSFRSPMATISSPTLMKVAKRISFAKYVSTQAQFFCVLFLRQYYCTGGWSCYYQSASEANASYSVTSEQT